jgi:predicted RNA binding protein YcfA (HicA-like mRNA interferase family)
MCRFLEKEGFLAERQSGSHRFYRHPDGRTTVVPIHTNKDLKRRLVLAMLKQIKMSRDEFLLKFK